MNLDGQGSRRLPGLAAGHSLTMLLTCSSGLHPCAGPAHCKCTAAGGFIPAEGAFLTVQLFGRLSACGCKLRGAKASTSGLPPPFTAHT